MLERGGWPRRSGEGVAMIPEPIKEPRGMSDDSFFHVAMIFSSSSKAMSWIIIFFPVKKKKIK